jgi:hypothetical protein
VLHHGFARGLAQAAMELGVFLGEQIGVLRIRD